MYTAYCRTVQSSMRVGMKLMNWRKPELLQGENSLEKLPDLVKSLDLNMLLVITDEGIHKLGLMDKLLEGLQEQNIAFVVYSKTVPNPTFTNIEEALELYNVNNCDGIIAFGGGSPMDCAKAVAARIARPDKSSS